MSKTGCLRIHSDGTKGDADSIAARITSKLSGMIAEPHVSTPRPYFKVSGTFEFFIAFKYDGIHTTFDDLLSALSDGWELEHRSGAPPGMPRSAGPARLAVWNSQGLVGGAPLAPFVEPGVVWALMKED